MSWSSFALVSLVVQAKDVDLRSSVACGEERTACICARIDAKCKFSVFGHFLGHTACYAHSIYAD